MSIDAEVLSPELVQLGLALGVITAPADGRYEFNGAFFSDPAKTLGAVLKDPARREALLGLGRSLLGEADLSVSSLPNSDPGESWMPLAQYGPATAYVVIDSTAAATTLAVAVGAEHDIGGVGLSGSIWLPLIRIPATGPPALLPGGPDGVIGVRVDVRPPPAAAGDPVALTALTAELAISTDGGPPRLDLVVEGLRLRDWPAPRDVRLSSDPAQLADEAADLTGTLLDLVAASTGLDPEAAAALHLVLTLAGLGDATRVPRLQIDAVLERGAPALREWAESILGDPTGGRQGAWLRVLAELARVDTAAIDVEGSPATGLRVRLSPPGSPAVYALVTVAVGGGHVEVDLGVSAIVNAPALGAGANAVPVHGYARVDLVHAEFAGTPVLTWLPRIELEAVAGNTATPLLPGADPRVRELHLGLATDDTYRVGPVLRAVDVTIGASHYESLDLTSVEAMTQAAGAAAAQGLGDVLEPLLGQNAAARVTALLVLLGIERPAGVAASWPALPAAAAFFADPLGTLGQYHARVLGYGGYDELVAAASVLFGIEDDVPGSGTQQDPWLIRIPAHEPVDLGTVDVLVYGTGGQAHPSLVIDVLITMTPVRFSDGTVLTVVGRHCVARLDLPVTAGEPLRISAADRHELELALEASHPSGVTPEDFTGIVDIDVPGSSVATFELPPARMGFEAGPVVVSCKALALTVRWERGPGWSGEVSVDEGAVELGDVSVELPDGFGLDWLGGSLDLSAFWDLLKLLLAGRLAMPRFGMPDPSAPSLPALHLPDLSLPDLGDISLPTLSLPELFAAFLGWMPATLPFRLRLPDGLHLDLDLPELGGGDWPEFDLPAFIVSPLPTLRLWLGQLFSGDVDLSLPAISLGSLLCGGVEVRGEGTYENPWAVALPESGGTAELLVWLDPDGPTLAGLDDVFADLVPDDLVSANPQDPPRTAADLLDVLAGGARIDRGLADLLAGRPGIATALERLRSAFVDGDGIVPGHAQVHPGDTRSDATLRATHLDAPARFVLADHSTADPSAVLYLCAPLPGGSPWPGQAAGAQLDLRGPGRPAGSFVFNPPAAGPWFASLPTRAEAGGHEEVVERLRVAVAAVTAAAGHAPVVVAHSVTSWVARALHADGTITTLITVAAPGTTGAPPGLGDDAALGDAARFLQSLIAKAGTVPQPLQGVAATIAACLSDARPGSDGIPRQMPFPVADFLPPGAAGASAGAGAGATPITAVVAQLASSAVDTALAQLVADAIGAVLDRLPFGGGPARNPVTHLGVGVGVTLPSVTVAGAVDAVTSLRADLTTVRLRSGGTGRPVPKIWVLTVLHRPDGWLVDTPAASIRRAEIHLDLVAGGDDGTGLTSAVQVVLLDAGLAGIRKDRVEIGLATLDATARSLLDALAASVSPVPEGGSLADVVALLDAVGLLRLGTGRSVIFDPDVTERLLADPLEHLGRVTATEHGRRAVVQALRTALGGEAAAVGRVMITTVPGVRLEIDPELATVQVTVEALTIAGVLELGAGFDVRLPFGRPAMELAWHLEVLPAGAPKQVAETRPGVSFSVAATGQVTAEVLTGRPQAAPITLLPTPDVQALAEYVGSVAVDQVLGMVLCGAADASDELLAVLRAVGLVDAGGAIRDVVTLLTDPLRWLTSAQALGSHTEPGRISPAKVAGVLVAISELTAAVDEDGATIPGLPLPLGGQMVARAEGDALALDVSFAIDAAAGAGVTAGGRFGLSVRVDPDWVPSTSLTAAVRVRAAGADAGLEAAELEFTGGVAGADGLQAVLRLWPDAGTAPTVVQLLPTPSGLGPLAALVAQQAAEHALPLLLEQLADLGSADPDLAALGDAIEAVFQALGLLDAAGTFDLTPLRQLAADPAAWLIGRFRTDPAAMASAIAGLAAFARTGPAVPGAIWAGAAGRVRLELTADNSGGPLLTLVLNDLAPLNGIAMRGRIACSGQGLGSSVLAIFAEPPDPVRPDPIELLPGAWPFIELHLGGRASADPPRLETGLWLDPPAEAGADALVVQVPFGKPVALVHRHGSTTDDDVTAGFVELILDLVVPLIANPVLGLEDVRDAIDQTQVGAESLGQLLESAGVLTEPDPQSSARRLVPGMLSDPLAAAIRAMVALVDAFLSAADLGPARLQLVREDLGAWDRYLVAIVLEEALALRPFGDVAVAVTAQTPGSDPVLEVVAVEVSHDLTVAAPVRFAPRVRVRGLGVAVTGAEGPLLKDPIRVQGIALYGSYEHAVEGFVRGGGRVQIQGIEIPVGGASGGTNPVASKVIAPDAAGSGSAVASRGPTPGITPHADIDKVGTGPVKVTVGLEGQGWTPIRRAFGPIYVEQIGFDLTTDPTAFALLIDAGVHIGPLAAGVDDLAVIIPLASPANPATWRLDLAGLAVSFDSGGVSIAGGMRRLVRAGGVEYVGMLAVRAAGYGLTALGAFGSFPVRQGSSDRYTSLLVIAALAAPLGGPPAFFVLGIGGGVGLNRDLIAPREMTEVANFPLIAALDPASQLVRDPMAALVKLGQTFPPKPGAFWLAAGVRFSSFTLVESIVAVTIAIGDGLEVNVLGVARAGLPNPAAPVAQLELALQARFSSREGILSIRAQLTDNSWLFSPACQLTGGFAFVIWFRTGEFVISIGGFHPRFARPAHYPTVPRVGFNWRVSSVITVKGESYFALTPTAIMTGGRLEAAADFGVVGAWFAAGIDVLVSWDPFFYDFSVYVTVGAWLFIEIKIWFIHIRIRITVSIGAELQIQGPPMHGVAIVDLCVTKIVVPFGPTAHPVKDWLGWAAFHDKYLVAGDPSGTTMDVTITRGSFTIDPGAVSGNPPADEILRLLPEFSLRTSTRAAATSVNGTPKPGAVLAAGPMGRARIDSRHVVSVRTKGSPPGQGLIALQPPVPVVGAVPDAVWRMPAPRGAGGMHDAYVGADVVANVTVAGSVAPIDVRQVQSGTPRLLPLLMARDPGGLLSAATEAAEAWTASVSGQDPIEVARDLMAQPAAVLARCLGGATAAAAAGLGVLDAAVMFAELSAPPRLERPTARVFTLARPAHTVTVQRPPQPSALTPPDVPAPVLLGAFRGDAVPSRRPRARTTVGAWGDRFPRTHPDDVDTVLARIRPVAARLYRASPATVVQPGGGAAAPTLLRSGARGGHAAPGGRVEAVRGLFADPATGGFLAAETAGLTGAGALLRAGDLHVWQVLGAADDWNPVRPLLSVTGDQAVRVCMLDLAGAPISDTTVTSGNGEVFLPPGVHRIAVLGTGVPATNDPAAAKPEAWPLGVSGLAGWHTGVPVLRAGDFGFVVAGGVMRTTGVTTLRARRPVDVALIDPADAVRGEGLVSTRLPAMTGCVVLAIRPTDPAASIAELIVGLDGASPAGDPDLVLTVGADIYVLRNLKPHGVPSVVTVGRAPGFTLRGVLGSSRPANVVARFIADRGVAALLGGLAPGAADGRARLSTLTWRQIP
jgi:hypothetical protein